jgi:hypothetical protein
MHGAMMTMMTDEELIEIITEAEQEAQPIVLVSSGEETGETQVERREFEGLGGTVFISTPREDYSALAEFWMRLQADRSQRQLLIETMLPRHVIREPALWHAQRNAEARHELISSYGAFTAVQLAEQVNSKAANKAATAYNWANRGRIFSVSYHGETLYPAFEFDEDGQPLPWIAPILAALTHSGMRGWEVALWFDTDNGWLDGATPLEVMRDDPDRVIAAAESRIGVVA